jgi:hypothetical protein
MHTDYGSVAPVVLTFDDGPDPIWTLLVPDALASHHLLSERVTTSPRLVGRATRSLSNDLAKIAGSLREEKAQG